MKQFWQKGFNINYQFSADYKKETL